MKNRLLVITGGPGVGKTTLLNALQADGYQVVPEAARAIIREQIETNGDAVPWQNKHRYTEKMIEASFSDYDRIVERQMDGVCFFDRGILDSVCYAEMIGYTLSNDVIDCILNRPYNPNVFILPPWKAIYEQDNERKQDWQEAERTYEQMKCTYERFGYEVITVPQGDVRERKSFVVARLMDILSNSPSKWR